MRFLNRQRLWTVYGATGDRSRPLKPTACVRANAKSIARGIVSRSPRYSHIPKRGLVVVEGCFAPGSVLRGLGGAKRNSKSKLKVGRTYITPHGWMTVHSMDPRAAGGRGQVIAYSEGKKYIWDLPHFNALRLNGARRRR